ncbi:sugar-binding transcriptional regulator [Microbacterium sp. SA39]|uniref:sugar-binding transcriptional regulator n=1 Tax=Microbacterium sp. SA39 TaxID=1263625 RepID=UPI0005F9ACA6|nr:sugar-binding transcriptional regulator [Microbacterium sp. SA39]KJQ52887.1 Deoxyribonucleoside regulator [Microbacterium sp. SA39]
MTREPRRAGSNHNVERLRLLAKVARMYYEQGIRQPQIAARLGMSQSRVSRSLKEAGELGIVRTIVVPPSGVYSEVEDALRDRFGLRDAVVADTPDDSESAILRALGAAGAAYLESTLTGDDRVGISSWSSTLLATAESMTPRTVRTAVEVVQIIGGVGKPSVQVKATRLTEQFARVTGATPRFLAAPGVVSSKAVRDALLEDPFIAELSRSWQDLSVALVGIGSLEPSPLLRESGNALGDDDLSEVRALGGVGDVCLRFFDEAGTRLDSPLDERIVGISAEALRAVSRVIGIAGGARKLKAIRGALRGGWINILITDLATARALLADDAPDPLPTKDFP